MDNSSEKVNPGTSAYKRQSPLMWVAIYAIVGLLVYGAIYYFAFYKKGNSMSYTPKTENITPEASNSANNMETVTDSATVLLSAEGFDPKTLTIKKGTKVTWINQSGVTATVNSGPHPQHTDYSPLNLNEFEDGGSLSLTFDTPGTYKYHNHLNSKQFGIVTVVE